MHKYFCDDCKKVINKFARCKDCNDEKDYHASCLKKINDERYCKGHALNHLENGMIVSYLRRTWAGLKLGGVLSINGLLDRDKDWANVEVKFPDRLLHFYARYDNYDKQITFKHRDHVETVRVHHHAGFRKALKTLVIQALEREIELLHSNIRNYEKGIKHANRDLKTTKLILDVVNGKAKWPDPAPTGEGQLVEVRF